MSSADLFFTAATRILPKPRCSGDYTPANAIWLDKSCELSSQFTKSAIDTKTVQQVDFAGAPDEAGVRINRWVNEATNGRIPKLLDTLDVNERTKIVLTNAVTFDGRWDSPFPSSATAPGPFFKTMDQMVLLPMTQSDSVFVKHFKTDNHELIEIPLLNSAYQFAVILPTQSKGIADLCKLPWPRELEIEMSLAEWRKAKLSMPRFRVQASHRLKRHLLDLGLFNVFQPGAFDGLTNTELTLREIKQAAIIDVHEEGIDASAATAAILDATSDAQAEEIVINIDRPFMYLVRHKATGLVVFVGVFAGQSSS